MGIAVVVLVLQSLTADVISIEPLSVPKIFADNGYTADVARERLRDAINNFAANSSTMPTPGLALTSELPKITIPKFEISVDAIGTLVRSVFHFGRSRDISGEFILRDDLVWLRLRVNEKPVFESHGVPPSNVDELLASAAPKILEEIQPYLVAANIYNQKPDDAVERADDLIARFPETDVNAQWSLVLKASYFLDRRDYKSAEPLCRRAIRLNSRNAGAHYDLGACVDGARENT